MPTVLTIGAFRIAVLTNDHGPAHVHAFGPDGYAKFLLGDGPNEVREYESEGIRKGDLKRIAKAIIDGHDACLSVWRAIHGN